MKFGSVCSGIEAASVAFHPLGMSAAWLAEVDVAASTVLSHRLGATAPRFMPDPDEIGISDTDRKARLAAMKNIERQEWGNSVVNWGDMTKLPAAVLAGEAEAPEVLCGGTPCQSFSIAGLRGGMSDGRGQLTLSFVELANAIDFKRAERGEQPCTILWENVPGIFSDKTNAFGCFLAGLAGEDLPLEPPGGKWKNAGVVLGPKRAIAWIVKDAQFFGLAQRRRRVFVIASSREGFDPAKVLFEFDGLRRDSAPSREAREEIAGTADAGVAGSHWDEWRNPHPSLTQSHNTGGVGSSNQELFSQRGAYLVPGNGPERSAGVTFRMVAFGEYSEDGSASTIKARDYKDATDLVVSPDVIAMAHGQGGAEISIDRCPTLTCNHEVPIAAYALQAGVTRQNPNSGPDGVGVQEDLAYTIEARPEVQLTAYGFQPRIGRNGRGDMGELCNALTAQAGETGKGDAAPCVAVVQPQAVCVTGDITHTLRAEGFDASEDGTGRGQPIVPVYPLNTQVITRNKAMGRGTGFGLGGADDPAYTVSAAHSHAVYANMSVRRLMPVETERLQGFDDNWTLVPVGKGLAADGPRYKQIGNSWAVNCVRWIGARLVDHLRELDQPKNDNNPLHLWMVAA